MLVQPLESAYPPLSRDRLPPQGTLVVLGGGVSPLVDFPASDRLGRASLRRALEAVRLYHLMGGPEIIVCGGPGNPFSPVAEAPVLREFLVGVGIPEKKILVETESRTTFENVERLLAMPLKRPLILISSARHMSRACGSSAPSPKRRPPLRAIFIPCAVLVILSPTYLRLRLSPCQPPPSTNISASCGTVSQVGSEGDGVSCIMRVNPLFLCSSAGKPFINKPLPQRGCSVSRKHSYAVPGGGKDVAFS